ncbi:uncharacterized protein BCR38DRAFT_446733 [Pseudomassariella vexata]|uniref:Uncharacterized protein n=1 Tax=Pseudomassariella vexata TaxID=1141098 RepID=A0A1Y2DI66_9PEZI|nr:uncharacterized protein BCR38DRAFT_446733 [Pseudomassariella vexata]ORY58834.1 hypothetical protein BCR38DRAFT_446733 [Pseudomassariella vexata]
MPSVHHRNRRANCQSHVASNITRYQGGTDTKPYQGYHDNFRIQELRLKSEFLDIYAVKCLCGRTFEAQAFSLSCPCRKLLESRKRRMKRIYRSQNFVNVFDSEGKRFLVTQTDRSPAEWENVCHQIKQGGNEFENRDEDGFFEATIMPQETSTDQPTPPSTPSFSYADILARGLERQNEHKGC